jgi:toxin-antitoxin system PIN domain toxin
MIALDTNILVYAHRGEMPFHRRACACLRGVAEGGAPWALPWPAAHEFLAVVTNARIFREPTPMAQGIVFLSLLMGSPSLHLIGEGSGYFPVLRDLLVASEVTGARVHDARIAAICLHHNVRALWSADRDHGRFEGLKVVNPLLRHETP